MLTTQSSFLRVLIKVSILFQYTRVAPANFTLFRRFCFALIAITSVWGLANFFMTVFGCSPISAAWEASEEGTYWFFASRDINMRVKT